MDTEDRQPKQPDKGSLDILNLFSPVTPPTPSPLPMPEPQAEPQPLEQQGQPQPHHRLKIRYVILGSVLLLTLVFFFGRYTVQPQRPEYTPSFLQETPQQMPLTEKPVEQQMPELIEQAKEEPSAKAPPKPDISSALSKKGVAGPEMFPLPSTPLSINAKEQVFPDAWRIREPVSLAEEEGIFEEMLLPDRNLTISLNNLRISVVMDDNLDYHARVRWEASMPVDVSNVFVEKKDYNRLSGKSKRRQIESKFTKNQAVQEMEIQNLQEDEEYLFTVQTCFTIGPCLAHNVTVRMPPVQAANVHCSNLVTHGQQQRKLDLIFVPYNYSYDALARGEFERDVRYLLFYGDPQSENLAVRRSFFDIPVLNKSFDAFNVVVVNDEVPCCFDNQLFAIGKACGFDRKDDVFVVLQNMESGTAYAQDIGQGIWVMLTRASNLQGVGAVLAHELAHLIGMDEEYYLHQEGALFPRNAPNCDYGNLSCKKWCKGVNRELQEEIHQAKATYDACATAVQQGNTATWQALCPSLDLARVFEKGLTVYGAASQQQLCALPTSSVQAYVCSEGILMPLEDKNLGEDCKEGYGCYFGCGTQYYFTRGDYVSIMGGGSLGENNRIYSELEATSPGTVFPDYSKATAETLEKYFRRFR